MEEDQPLLLPASILRSRDPIVAYQGSPGANSQRACAAFLPDFRSQPCYDVDQTLKAVERGEADLALVPVENVLAGRVADVHLLLPQTRLKMVGEAFLPVQHHLLGLPGTPLDQVKTVLSHPQALWQCRETLSRLKVATRNHADTAGAAEFVATRGDDSLGAVASQTAADVYGLSVLQANIADDPNNVTRFVAFSREALTPHDWATSERYGSEDPVIYAMLIETRSIPAALYKCLGGFATEGVNLLRLESYLPLLRPQRARFYLEAEATLGSDAMLRAMKELRFFAEEDGLRILGVFPQSPLRYQSAGRVG